ncbi:MAG: hypothetical protein NC085_11175, partial [Muribaculaceae bacterium]|nr:hypothetical protein [Muribaculaceae bacterium]
YRKADGKIGYKYEKREHKRLAHEIVTSCGNSTCEKNADGTVCYDKNNRHIRPQEVPYEVNYAINKRYFETFEKRNPNFIIVSCAWHNEEGFYNRRKVWEYGTPQMHLVYIPIGTGYKQGLARQVSIGKALGNIGYKTLMRAEKSVTAMLNNAVERLMRLKLRMTGMIGIMEVKNLPHWGAAGKVKIKVILQILEHYTNLLTYFW